MKILIIDDLFSTFFIKYKISIKLYYAFENYKIIKIKQLVRKLRNKYGRKTEIKILTNGLTSFNISKNIEVEQLSEYRALINREDFEVIRNRMIIETKRNLKNILANLKNIGIFELKNLYLGDAIEFVLAGFFKSVISKFEFLRRYLQSNSFEKVILFKCNPNYFEFYKSLSKYCASIEYHPDPLMNLSYDMYLFYFIKYSFDLIVMFFKEYLNYKKQLKIYKQYRRKSSILFIHSSKNQFESIRPIYEFFKKDNNIQSIQYQDKNFLPILKIFAIIKLYYHFTFNWRNYKRKIYEDLNYDLMPLNQMLSDFFRFEIILRILRLYNNYLHINRLFKTINPSLVIIADELRAESRFYAKYTRRENVPSMYITHGSIPIWPELTSTSDFKIITAPGEFDKEYLIKKGEKAENIVITGRPRFEDFYKGKIKTLNKIIDMNDNREFNLDSDKLVILFATSPVDYKSREIIFRNVILALKKLDLIENLVIKLHPREDGKLYNRILRELSVSPIMVKDYDLFELMKSSNIYLSRTSATILEAMIMGIPIILLDFVNLSSLYTGIYQFCEEDYLIKVKTQDELCKELSNLAKNPDFLNDYSEGLRQLAKQFSYYDENQSASKIINNLIRKIVKNQDS